MRRIVMFNRVSADGFFAAADGNLDWVVPDAEVDRHGAAGIPGTDTVILGRRTYEQFASFWPHVLDSPAPCRPARRRASRLRPRCARSRALSTT